MTIKEKMNVVLAGFSIATTAAVLTTGFYLIVLWVLGLEPSIISNLIIGATSYFAGGWAGTWAVRDQIGYYRARKVQ